MTVAWSAERRIASGDLPRGTVLFAIAAATLLLVAFLVVPYLPMVDLPQHAAQVTVWLHLDDPAFPWAGRFVINWGTPYLTAYVVARVLGSVVGVVTALKCIAWASAVLHACAFAQLSRRLGHPSWLGLLGLPLGLGYPFYFGLVSFHAAMPIVLFSITAALVHRDGPTWRRGTILALVLSLLLVTHGFALGLSMMMCGPLLLRGGGRLVARVAPLLAPVLLWAVWFWPARSVRAIGTTIWEPRLLDLLPSPSLWFASSSADHLAVVLGYAALGIVVASVGRPSRSIERLVPLALLVVAFCTFPLMLQGFGPLHPRFAALFVPGILVACEPRAARNPVLPAFAVALCSAFLAVFVARLVGFTRETQPVRDFVDDAPPGLCVRPVVFERESTAFPGLPALLHLSAYYLAAKGGLQGYSFAMYPTSVVRFSPTVIPTMGGGAEWHPETFSPDEVPDYDRILVHSTADRAASLFGPRRNEVSLDFHKGDWWAYRVLARTVAHAVPEGGVP